MDKNIPHTPAKRNFDCETDQIDNEYTTPKKYLKKNDPTKQKIKRLQKYKSQWEIEHGDWLINDPLNEYNGKCKFCGITFTVASAGIGQVCNIFSFFLYVHGCVCVFYFYGCIKYQN